MKTLHIAKTGVENLQTVSRANRLLVGAGLIAFVMATPEAPLGWYAVLPLLAIYPIFTAIIGWDPIKAFFQHPGVARWGTRLPNPVRYIMAVIGVACIGSVYVAAYYDSPLGLLAILPILGIYPMFSAITGIEPITALYNLNNTGFEFQEETKTATSRKQQPVFEVVNSDKKVKTRRAGHTHGKAA